MKHFTHLKKLLLLIIILMGAGMLTMEAQYSKYASGDAVIYEAAPDDVVSHASNLFIGSVTGDDEIIALVKFDISGLGGKQIESAEFSTRSDMNDGTTMTVKLTGAGAGFARDTTSWNKKPSISGTELATVVLDQESDRKIYVETGSALTDYINSKIAAGDAEVAFALQYKDGDGGDFKWMGGQGDASWGPLLEMTFSQERGYMPTADGTIYEAYPDSAVGHGSNIYVAKPADGEEVVALVQFNLAGLAYRQIGIAEFSTRSDMNDGKTMTVKLTPAGNDFDRTVTWASKPSLSGDELATVVLDQESDRKTYVETGSAMVDYINGKLAMGEEVVSFALRYKDGDGADFKWMGGKGDGSWGPMLNLGEITDLPAKYENTPLDDAVIYQAYPDSSVGHGSNIFVGKPADDEEVIALVKFDVSPFANRQVTAVKFSTRSDMNDGKTMTVKLTGAGTGFSRDTTNWGNKPSTSDNELASVVLDQESDRKVYVDNGTALVDYVNSKLMSGETELAFALRYKDGDGADFKWMGGKGDGSWGPMLELEFSTQSSLYGVKDGTIYEAYPDSAVGHNSNIFVGKAAEGENVIALVQFELSGLAYTEVEGASFSTRSDMNDGKTMTVKLTPAGDEFDRTTTWNTKPSTPGDELASAVLDQESDRKFYIENGSAFADYINGILATGEETVSLAIQYKDGDGADFKWMGGVGDGSWGPMLEITSPSLAPESAVFTVVEDVAVDEADPDANLDSKSDMGIRKADDGSSKEVYLKFDISEAANAVAGKVDLRLYIGQHNSGTQRDDFFAEVFAIETSEWDETTLTWNTKPEAGAKLIEGNVTWYNSGKDTVFMGAGLTHYFNEAVAAGKDHITLAIKGKDVTNGDRLWMAESNWKAEGTQLLVDYTVEPPEKVMPVVADVHVEQGDPDTNFEGGADQHLINDDSNSMSKWIYQKFDISSAYEDVISATLSVYASIFNGNPDPSVSEITFQVFGVDDIDWVENGVTWNTKPADKGKVLLEGVAKSSGKWFDLTTGAFTEFVNAAIDAGKDSLSVVIKAKEETPGNRAWVSGRGWRAPKLVLNYEKQAVAPRFVTAPGDYIGSVDVELATLTSGATIYYTLDESTPTDESAEYTEPITISDTTVINAIAYAPDLKESPVATAKYNVTPVGNIEFSLSATPKYQPPIEVAITAEPEDAVIRYSDDGGAPTTLYTEPLILEQTTTLRVQAYSADFNNFTDIVEVTYTIVPPTGTAGTGPAGVGFKDLSRTGQPEISLWLKPEMLADLAEGDNILQWPDASGNENHAYNSWVDGGDNGIANTAESQQQPPVLRADGLNGLPVAEMGLPGGDRTKGTLIVDDADNLDGGEGQSIFLVLKRNEMFADFAALFQKRDVRGDASAQSYVLEMNGGADPNTMQYVVTRDIFVRTDRVFNADDYYLLNTGLNGNLGLAYFLANGNLEKTVAYDKPILATDATMIIGGFQPVSIAEVAYFNSTLNAPQTYLVHEYLAAKYGLTLEGGNMYTNTEYTSDLIGIGKATDLAAGNDEEHLHATGGALEIQSDGLADAGDYVMAAHNGAELAEGANQVWDRMWYVQTAGNGGDVTLSFDFAKAGLTLAADGYILAHRASMSDSWTDLGITPSADGDLLVFNVPAIQDGYYAIGKALPSTTSTANPEAGAEFSIYPNPAANQVTVSFSNEETGAVTLTVYDLSGRVAASNMLFKTSGMFESTMDISTLDRGMYMIEVKQGDNKSIKPLMVK